MAFQLHRKVYNKLLCSEQYLMISYGNPVCQITNQRATIFCCAQNCTQPAFGCTADCLFSEGHVDHRTMLWSDIQESVRVAIQLPLSKQELLLLEKQEKQLKIITEQLKSVMANHEKAIIQCKSRLQLKGAAERVLSAIREKRTDQVTSTEMAQLVDVIQRADLFKNKLAVCEAMNKRNKLVDELFPKILSEIEWYRQHEKELPNPKQITCSDLRQKIYPTVDIPNSSEVVINQDVISVGFQNSGHHSIFAQEDIADGQSFQVEVVDYKGVWFMIGVATADLRRKINQYDNQSSICIHANGLLYFNGESQQCKFKLKTNDKVIVKRYSGKIQWLRDKMLLCSAPIPNYTPYYGLAIASMRRSYGF